MRIILMQIMGFNAIFVQLTLYILFIIVSPINGAKILGIFVFPGPSQYIYGSALLKELAERGHEVTSISAFPQKKPLKNFHDITIFENTHLTDDEMADLDTMRNRPLLDMFFLMYDMSHDITVNVLQNAEVQKLLQSKTAKFDLIITEAVTTEALFGMAQHFSAPIIGVSTFGTISWIDNFVGNTSPVSYVPHSFLPIIGKMTYKERLLNLAINICEYFQYNYYHLPRQNALYQKYFPHAKQSLRELIKNLSLVFINQHFTIDQPRPFVPNMIEVGGLHIKQQPEPLPLDMQQFLDNATEGAIYFSMGSNLRSIDLAPEKRKILLDTFASLRQKVLWKFEDDAGIPDKPDNLYISKWFPQPSILAHPNVKVFITHGGWLSTTESLFHTTPILGIPMFMDQHTNVAKAVAQGFALSVDYNNLNELELKQKLNDLLYNEKYKLVVAAASKRFRDKPMTAMETAIYWTEYVLRHDGAAHLRNAGQDLNVLQYHSIDTILTLFGGILSIVITVLYALLKIIQFVFCKSTKKQKLKKK